VALPPYQIYESLPGGSEVINGGHTARQVGDLISLLLFLESRLITEHTGKDIFRI
jgi:hypothetical protein